MQLNPEGNFVLDTRHFSPMKPTPSSCFSFSKICLLIAAAVAVGTGCTQVQVAPDTRGEYKLGELQVFADRDFARVYEAAKAGLKDSKLFVTQDDRKVVEAENRAVGLTLDYKTDADDREGWFSRSDHYPFAVKGVPVAFFNTGEHPDYHTPNDTWDRLNYPKMEKIVKLVYLSTRTLANSPSRPRFVTSSGATGSRH
jgi:hypothetical protein